jgi:DNA-binding NarL/FixJ family response regulator
MIRVLIVDDQELMRLAIRTVLAESDGIEVVGEARDGASAMKVLIPTCPDIVLFDVRGPRMDGLGAAERIVRDSPARVVIMASQDGDEHMFAALRAGASGLLVRGTLPGQLVAAIRSVARGDVVLPSRMTRRLIRHALAGAGAGGPGRDELLRLLTDREYEVLCLMRSGLTNREIAERLVVSATTVKTHVSNLLAKLGARNRIEAAIIAHDAGLGSPPSVGGAQNPPCAG